SLVESVYECAVLDKGASLFVDATHAEVAVRQGQNGLHLCGEFRPETLFNEAPLVGRIVVNGRFETFVVKHFRCLALPIGECASRRQVETAVRGTAWEAVHPNQPQRTVRRSPSTRLRYPFGQRRRRGRILLAHRPGRRKSRPRSQRQPWRVLP